MADRGKEDAAIEGQAGAVPAMLADILKAGLSPRDGGCHVVGVGDLTSAFAVTDLAAASIGAAGMATAEFARAADGRPRAVAVDRRLASAWFGFSIRPRGWTVPPPWDPIAGDYPTRDGWIRLHTNAPAHREAALRVLGVPAAPEAVRPAVGEWEGEALEAAVVAAGGCAAVMRTEAAWNASPAGRAVRAEPLVHWDLEVDAPALVRPPDLSRPLAGVRVLDLTRVLAGPVATRYLAMLGADVLRVDSPDWDEPGVVPEVMLGKRGARLDLRAAEDRRTFASLVAGSDVLVHGYRPGALDGLGFGSEALRAVRPGLIEVSLDAYGWTGPWRGRRGFDSLVQMSTGIADSGMRRFGSDAPRPLPVQALDHATGYLVAFAAIQALTERLRDGRSRRARLSLARTAALLTAYRIEAPAPLLEEQPDDLDAAIEETAWGPAQRLRPPLSVEGVVLRAERPAMLLGAHAARW